MNIVNV